MPRHYDIRNVTGIQDKHIQFDTPATKIDYINGKKAVVINATLTYKPKACNRCGIVNEDYLMIKNGTQTARIRLCHTYQRAPYMDLRKQRFYCKACCQTFVAETFIVSDHCFISKAISIKLSQNVPECLGIRCSG